MRFRAYHLVVALGFYASAGGALQAQVMPIDTAHSEDLWRNQKAMDEFTAKIHSIGVESPSFMTMPANIEPDLKCLWNDYDGWVSQALESGEVDFSLFGNKAASLFSAAIYSQNGDTMRMCGYRALELSKVVDDPLLARLTDLFGLACLPSSRVLDGEASGTGVDYARFWDMLKEGEDLPKGRSKAFWENIAPFMEMAKVIASIDNGNAANSTLELGGGLLGEFTSMQEDDESSRKSNQWKTLFEISISGLGTMRNVAEVRLDSFIVSANGIPKTGYILSMAYQLKGLFRILEDDPLGAITAFQKRRVRDKNKGAEYRASYGNYLLGWAELLYFQKSNDLAYLESAKENLKLALAGLGGNTSGEIFEKEMFGKQTDQIEIIETLLQVLIELKRATGNRLYLREAFEACEQMRAVTLRNRMQMRNRAPFERTLGRAYREAELALNRTRFKMEYAEKGGGLNFLQAQAEYELALAQLNMVRDSLESTIPALRVLRENPRSATVAGVQSQLSADEAVLSYNVCASNIFVFVLRSDTFEMVTIRRFPNDKANAYRFLQAIENQDFEAYTRLAAHMYGLYYFPIRRLVRGKHLRIARNGFLERIPFEAFLSEVGWSSGQDYKNLEYLIRQHEISYIPSVSLYKGYSTPLKKQASGPTLFIAPGNFGFLGTDKLDQEANADFAEDAAGRSDGESLTYDDATEPAFWKQAHGRKLVYLGSHAESNQQSASLGSLFLGPGDKNSASSHEDGSLHAWELYAENLDNELVMLNACATGVGPEEDAEGTISLARAFLISGANSVVYTAWPVDDASSNIIAESFLLALANGKTRSAAIREAKLDYITNQPKDRIAPFWWCGLQLVGDPGPMEITFTAKEDTSRLPLFLAAISAFILGTTWYGFKKWRRK